MGQTLTNGIYLPNEGERNCYSGLAANWNAVDTLKGNYSLHAINVDIHVTAAEKETWNGKADNSALTAHTGDTTIHVTSADKQAWNGHVADTTIHVTSADKSKWNTVTSKADASALTAHTGNTTIHVTAEDKAKWDAVTSKADDSDVVHKSGNETKNGELTLNDTLNTSNIIPNSNNTYDYGTVSNLLRNLYAYHGYFRGQQQNDEYSSNTRTNLTLLSNRDTLDESGILFDTYRQNTAQGTGIHILGISIKENSVRYEGCRFGWYWDNSLNGYYLDFKPTTQGTYQAVKHNLGTSTDKWDTINGLNPSALGMPDLDNGIDISSYITVVANANKESLYTPPSNGWISVALTRTSGSHAVLLKQGNFASSGHNIAQENGTTTCNAMLPVKGGVQVSINSALADGIAFAYFYPCLGNI